MSDNANNNETPRCPPLVVDLDGTLLNSDILLESIFALLKKQVFYIFLLPVWLLGGKARFKHEIASRVDIDVATLPYNTPLLEHLKAQKAKGRLLVLATASNIKFAQEIAVHLGVFDDVLASDETTNLSGDDKASQLKAVYGERGFDYAGNSMKDVKVWRHATKAVVVNPERGVEAAARAVASVDQVFVRQAGKLTDYLKAMRLHQWLKNILVFVPLVAAHEVTNIGALWQAGLAFLAFSLCASSVYLLNDLMDLPADRRHPRKRLRPFASGTVHIINGAMLIPALLLVSLLIALVLPVEFLWVLVGYYLFTLGYSVRFKRIVMFDVLVLAGLYTLRLIGGAAAVAVVPSFWLLAFSMFIFLSLAMVKRYSELFDLQGEGEEAAARGRGYYVGDLETLMGLGGASGYLAVLVLALYINSEEINQLYAHPYVIWLLCPLLLFWISRIWLDTRRGKMHDDPLVFAVRDPMSRGVALVGLIVVLVAT